MNRPASLLAVLGFTTFLAAGVLGCGSDNVSSDEQAELAYLGLDQAVEKSLALGFAGFNTASSANISQQQGAGSAAGVLLITGQVDQGSSSNKGMRLRMGLAGYSDGPVSLPAEDGKAGTPYSITYATSSDTTAQPEITLSLRNIPTGTFTGTLIGTFQMQGDLEGNVALDLTLSGELESDGSGTRRKAGTTHVTGTAVSGDGEYQVDVTI